MPRSVPPALRASETVTIRLTRQQRALLVRAAAALGMTITDFLKDHICRTANQLGLETDPGEASFSTPAAADRAPGRSSASWSAPPPPDSTAPGPPGEGPAAFGELARRYRATFAERGEGTRRELDEAVRFLTEPRGGGGALLPPETPLRDLSAELLGRLRDGLRDSPLRLSRKNLILTYLRMMLHSAFKRREIAVDFAPGAELRPIAASEVADPWSAGPPGPPAR